MGQRAARGGGTGLAIGPWKGHTGHRLDTCRHQISAGVDRHHAGHRARRTGIDAGDVGMGVGAAQEDQVGLPGQDFIIGVVPLASDQGGVFVQAAGVA